MVSNQVESNSWIGGQVFALPLVDQKSGYKMVGKRYVKPMPELTHGLKVDSTGDQTASQENNKDKGKDSDNENTFSLQLGTPKQVLVSNIRSQNTIGKAGAKESDSEKDGGSNQGSKTVSRELNPSTRDTGAKSKSVSNASKSFSPSQSRLKQKVVEKSSNPYKAELEIINEKLSKRDAKMREPKVKEVKPRELPAPRPNRVTHKIELKESKVRGHSAEGVRNVHQRETLPKVERPSKAQKNGPNKENSGMQSGKKEAVSSTRLKQMEPIPGKKTAPSFESAKSHPFTSSNSKKMAAGAGKGKEADSSGRKYSYSDQLLQLFNGVFYNIAQAKSPFKYHVGPGNNSEKVISRIKRRRNIEIVMSPNGCNVVWTQLICRVLRNTTMFSFNKLAMSSVYELLDEKPTEKTPEAFAQNFLNQKLFRVRDESLVLASFHKLFKKEYVGSIISENLNIGNHIKGLMFISRKFMLAKTVIEHCSKTGQDPFKVIPLTFFVQMETYDADLTSMVKSVRDVQTKASKTGMWDPVTEYIVPIIIKPGEYSNRGKGITIAYNEKDLKNLTSNLFVSKKKELKAVTQTYLTNPLLFKNRKFDLRCYCLVTKFIDRMVVYWYSQGYARTSSYVYDERDKSNLMVHLTNEAVQVQGMLSEVTDRFLNVWKV